MLASSPDCRCQALRADTRAWGLQYHVELEPTTIPEWGCVPAYAEALASTHGEGGLQRMAEAAQPHMQRFAEDSERLYRNFMRQVRA